MAKIAVVLTLALSTLAGCGAARSALGALGGGGSKPTANVTVVNEINVPAPAPAPAPVPVVVEANKPHGARRAVLGGALAGSILGGVVGALDHADAKHIGAGMAIGAAAGAGVGYVAHATE